MSAVTQTGETSLRRLFGPRQGALPLEQGSLRRAAWAMAVVAGCGGGGLDDVDDATLRAAGLEAVQRAVTLSEWPVDGDREALLDEVLGLGGVLGQMRTHHQAKYARGGSGAPVATRLVVSQASRDQEFLQWDGRNLQVSQGVEVELGSERHIVDLSFSPIAGGVDIDGFYQIRLDTFAEDGGVLYEVEADYQDVITREDGCPVQGSLEVEYFFRSRPDGESASVNGRLRISFESCDEVQVSVTR